MHIEAHISCVGEKAHEFYWFIALQLCIDQLPSPAIGSTECLHLMVYA